MLGDSTPAAGDRDQLTLLKAVADPTRLAVLELLAGRGQRCHCELEEELAVATSRLSFHLRVLREAGLVRAVRCGRRVGYHLADDAHERLVAALPTAPVPQQVAVGAGGDHRLVGATR